MEELCGRKNDRIPQREGRIKDVEMRFRSYLRIPINVAEGSGGTESMTCPSRAYCLSLSSNEFGADSERQRTEVLIKCSHCINKSN